MLDKILSLVSLKHNFYMKLKLQPQAKVKLENKKNLSVEGIFPFHRLIIDKPLTDSYNLIPGKFSKFLMSDHDLSQIADLFNPIFETNSYSSYTIDISDLEAFTSSKSELAKFSDIDSFTEIQCPGYIKSITEEALAEMLRHDEVNIVKSAEIATDEIATDFFIIFGWSPKITICNAGGSHHLAAAQYIAKRLKKFVCIEAEVTYYTLNESALVAFNKRYTSFVLPYLQLAELINDFKLCELKFLRMSFSPYNDINYDIYFFENTAQNKRIISMFKERYTCLNDDIEKGIRYQKQNKTFIDFIECVNLSKTAVKIRNTSE